MNSKCKLYGGRYETGNHIISEKQQSGTKIIQVSAYPVNWGCRINQLLLCKGVRPP